MDELKLIISTKFMRNIITKILAKVIYKKTGYHIDIQINRVEADTYDGVNKQEEAENSQEEAENSQEDLM